MMVFKRSFEAEPKKLRPGEYIQYKHTEVWAVFKCPQCGFVTSLSKKNHNIRYDGLVSPVTHCPHKLGSGGKCEFNADVTLDGWLPEAKGSA